MAPETERPPTCSDGASARDVVQETHDVAKSDLSRTCSFPLVTVHSNAFIPRKTVTKYGATDEFLRLREYSFFVQRPTRESCSLDAHHTTRTCAAFRARYCSPWCSYAPPPPNSRRSRRPTARRSRHRPSLRRRPGHSRHRLAHRRQASRARERSARAEEMSSTTAMWCTPTPLKFASQ